MAANNHIHQPVDYNNHIHQPVDYNNHTHQPADWDILLRATSDWGFIDDLLSIEKSFSLEIFTAFNILYVLLSPSSLANQLSQINR